MLFESHSHQRFEGGVPKQGLQTCNRTIQIDKNIDGCDGYRLTPGDGFIISIINMDSNHPLWDGNYQMTPKPMRVVEKGTSHISLRGYEVLARTPFGYQSFDMSDYGITIFVENDEIVKVRLDMFDRNTYIEYYK